MWFWFGDLADDPWVEDQTTPYEEAQSWYRELPETALLVNGSGPPAGQQEYSTLEGWGDVFASAGRAVQRVAGYAYGGLQAAAGLGRSLVQSGAGGESASRWQGAMAAAQTVADQLLVFESAIRSVQAAIGRELTPEERAGYEKQVFGPEGAPRGLPGDTPAVSAASSWQGFLVPAVLIGAGLMLGKKAAPFLLVGGLAWYVWSSREV